MNYSALKELKIYVYHLPTEIKVAYVKAHSRNQHNLDAVPISDNGITDKYSIILFKHLLATCVMDIQCAIIRDGLFESTQHINSQVPLNIAFHDSCLQSAPCNGIAELFLCHNVSK